MIKSFCLLNVLFQMMYSMDNESILFCVVLCLVLLITCYPCVIQVNGVMNTLPLNLNDGAIQAYQDGTYDVIITDFGLKVTYDLVYHITVTVPGNYRGKTCGLCGNFNNDNKDDFQLPDGKAAKNLLTFGAAWTVGVPGVVTEDGCSGDHCPKCDDKKTVLFGKH